MERQWICFSPTMKQPYCQSCYRTMRRRLVIRIQACPFYTTIVDTTSDLTPKDQTNILTIRNTRNIRNFNTAHLFVTGQTGAPNEILSMGPRVRRDATVHETNTAATDPFDLRVGYLNFFQSHCMPLQKRPLTIVIHSIPSSDISQCDRWIATVLPPVDSCDATSVKLLGFISHDLRDVGPRPTAYAVEFPSTLFSLSPPLFPLSGVRCCPQPFHRLI